MSTLRLSTVLISAVLAAATLPGSVQFAAAQTVNPSTNRLIRQNQLQSLQRQQYQQQQQINRELDRRVAPQPRPQVPVVRQACPIQIVNNQIVRVCR